MQEETIFDAVLDYAIRFAAKAHDGQIRKTGSRIPYICHPVSVGFILVRAGLPRDVVIAGLLHDILEDTETTAEEVEKAFGEKVRSLVECVSEDKSLGWEDRKRGYDEQVFRGDEGAKAIAAADKLHNVRSIIADLRGGEDVWPAFKRDKETTIGHYRHFAEELHRRWDHPLSEELLSAVACLEELGA